MTRKSLLLISAIVKDVPEEIVKKCTKKIEDEIEELEETADFLSESLDVFSR